MASTRDEVQLVVDILGQEGIDRLAKSTENYKRLIEELAASYKRGDIATEEWIKSHARMTTELEREQAMLDRLIGKPGSGGGGGGGGGGGSGLLGASYAAQDFISVLSGGGGLGRALGAVSNNVPQLLQALGAGAGLAGVFSVVTAAVAAGIPILEKWWGAASDPEALEKAKQALEDFQAKAKSAREEFEKLRNAPTDYERKSAGQMREFLEGGNADRMKSGLVATMGARSGQAGMSDEEKAEYGALGAEDLTDAGIERVGAQAATAAGMSGANPAAMQAAREEAITRARQARDRARDRRAALLDAGKQRRAEQLLAGMGKVGAEGDAARGEVMKRAGETPGAFPANTAQHLAEMLPSALEAYDNEDAAEEERNRNYREMRARQHAEEAKKRREQEAHNRRMAERTERALQGNANRAARGRAADEELAGAVASAPAAPTPAELRQARSIQAGIRADGGNASIGELVAAIRRSQEQANQARQQGLDALVGAMTGAGDEIAQWRAASMQARAFSNRMHRGMEQNPGPSGLQR